MKVKSNVKGILVLKSNNNKSSLTIKEGATKTLSIGEQSLYSKAVATYQKVGWLVKGEDKVKAPKPVVKAPVIEKPVVETPEVKAPVIEKPVVETPEVKAPVVETPVEPVKEVKETEPKKAKKVSRRTSKKVTKKVAKKTRSRKKA